LIDKQSQRLILETYEETSSRSPASVKSDYFKVEFKEAPTSQELVIRPYYGKDQRLGGDIKLRNENFRGYLLNASSVEKLPFGPLPLKTNQWVDESGHTHFHGDGHKH
jgi:hypothetical protein